MIKDVFALDTSGIIAYLADEKGADEVSKVLPQCVIPFICLSELYYIIFSKRGRAQADRIYGIVKGWGLETLYPNERVILNAARIKAVYRLGISDSYIASFALEYQITLLTKDNDYRMLRDEIKVQFIG